MQSTALEDKTNETLIAILKEAALNPQDKVGLYYGSCLKGTEQSAPAFHSLKKLFHLIDRMHSPQDLARVTADLQSLGINALFGFSVGQSLKDATQEIGFLAQGGFALPEEFRINAVLMNLVPFSEAFNCQASTRMVPAQRCAIW